MTLEVRAARLATSTMLAVVAACTTPNPEYCDDQTACTESPDRPFCDVTGDFEGSPNTCIATPFDASVAPLSDAGNDTDAAATDARPLLPPVSNNQPANLVLGAPNFLQGGTGAASLTTFLVPRSVGGCGDQLWITDGGNHRVLAWNSLPLVNQAAASFVVGQAAADENTPGTTASTLNLNSALADAFCDGTRLIVGDTENNRVLIWNTLPTTTGAPASIVLGQTDFTSSSSGADAGQLMQPGAIWTDGSTLLVSDTGNHRVLMWSSFPTANATPADIVIGQTGFGVSGAATPPSAGSLNSPRGLYYDGTRLFVADGLNSRILVWNGLPTANGQPADFVVGQTEFDDSDPHGGQAAVNAGGLFYPADVVVAFDSLFVSDNNNHRVVVFTPVPTTSAPLANAVLGQVNLNQNLLEPTMPSQRAIWSPKGLEVVGDQLYVAGNWNRVLRFTLSN